MSKQIVAERHVQPLVNFNLSTMPDNMHQSLVSTSIRWTTEEWGQIIDRLCVNQGSESISALAIQTIKARDIFLAQQVLPAGRHRKLVSIAQGVDGIRTKLLSAVQARSHADHNHRPTLLETKEGRLAQQAAVNSAGRLPAIEKISRQTATTLPATRRVRPEQQNSLKEAPAMTLSNPAQNADRDTLIAGLDGLAAQQLSRRSVMPEERESAPAQPSLQPTGMPAAGCTGGLTLMELARPFIMMIFEEFAKALVNVISAQRLADTVPAKSHRMRSAVAVSPERALEGSLVEKVQPKPSADETHQVRRVADETDMESAEIDLTSFQQGDEGDVFDVQPLFDPKLPPSADSDFKPKIGLVGTPGSDFEALRQRYPQLHMTIVQVDALPDVRKFGHCQRIIALHEEISPSADALLSRLLRYRYVRLEGGMNGIRAQIDAWLAAPGSIVGGSQGRVPLSGMERNAFAGGKRQSRYPKRFSNAG